MEIPVANLYYLLLYAWDRLEEGRTVDVSGVEHGRTLDLVARVLDAGARRALRRGLDRGYAPRTEATARLRGRVAFGPSVQRMLLPQARAVCSFDELTPDVLTNRIVRTTVGRLARVDDLDDGLRASLRDVYRRMEGVGEVELSRAAFGRVRLHAGNRSYRLLLSACELAHRNLLPREDGRGYRFLDPLRDERQMDRLFEAFLLGFFRRECPGVRASAETLRWAAEPLARSGPGRLPSMRTDVTLRGPGGACVVDAKYYGSALSRWHADGTFHSSNLYQITAYLRAMRAAGEPADGVLLYPVVEGGFDHTYRIDGHRVRLLTLDLRRPWPEIHDALVDLASWGGEGRGRLPLPGSTAVGTRASA